MFDPVPLVFSEFIPGDRVYGYACLWSCSLRRTRQDKAFFQLEFRDQNSSVLPGVMWDVDPDGVYECPVVVLVEGEASQYQGSMQIRTFSLHLTEDDVAHYLPTTYRPIEDLIDEFTGIIDMIDDDDLRELANASIEAAPGLWTAPAAIRFHGAYRGGLLEHTLNVMRFCLHSADIYGTRVDRDLLIASAALHDIGKCDAYDGPESRQPVEAERLMGHVVRGALHVERIAFELDYDGRIPITDLLHTILSHHGEQQFGAPVEPATAEALILSAADTLDADVTGYFDVWRDQVDGSDWAYSNQRKRWIRKPREVRDMIEVSSQVSHFDR